MDWVLFVVIVSTSMTDKAINSSNVPMATQQLCNAAKAQLIQAYQGNAKSKFHVICRVSASSLSKETPGHRTRKDKP
jgi:hypothetical protein